MFRKIVHVIEWNCDRTPSIHQLYYFIEPAVQQTIELDRHHASLHLLRNHDNIPWLNCSIRWNKISLCYANISLTENISQTLSHFWCRLQKVKILCKQCELTDSLIKLHVSLDPPGHFDQLSVLPLVTIRRLISDVSRYHVHTATTIKAFK